MILIFYVLMFNTGIGQANLSTYAFETYGIPGIEAGSPFIDAVLTGIVYKDNNFKG